MIGSFMIKEKHQAMLLVVILAQSLPSNALVGGANRSHIFRDDRAPFSRWREKGRG
jgi:hypothetical protein